MPLILVVPIVMIAVLAAGAFALRQAEGHAAELREALFLLLMLAVVSAGVCLVTVFPSGASAEVVHETAGSVSA
ncbi:hypothetical protein [Methylobacterium sp. ARG-1]|uniref:hypothetical protein n=1 Tax=Methylobacterium sp. ARG-1 TaxID=1692501 RepID=UPI0006829FE0|nr:hypothetical protein [Methylobacterium sp. ARG-1]KNY20396.1 hypothetical protein AKJ13_22470 [Methylobacterium sp. ARG-1]